MNDTFYLSDVRYYDSGHTAVEAALMRFALDFRGMVMDYPGIIELTDQLRARQEAIIKERPRLRRVEIDNFDPNEFGCHVKAGRVYLCFQRVKGYRVSTTTA